MRYDYLRSKGINLCLQTDCSDTDKRIHESHGSTGHELFGNNMPVKPEIIHTGNKIPVLSANVDEAQNY